MSLPVKEKTRDLSAETAVFLQNHLQLLLGNRELILKVREYFFAELPSTFVAIAWRTWASLDVRPTLGMLLLLWSEGALLLPCEKCGAGQVHIFHCHGNPMTPFGRYYAYRGVCDQCGEYVALSQRGDVDSKFITTLGSWVNRAREVAAEHQNREIANTIRPGSPQRFSWGKGLTEQIPEIKEVVRPKAVPVSLDELVERLRNERTR